MPRPFTPPLSSTVVGLVSLVVMTIVFSLGACDGLPNDAPRKTCIRLSAPYTGARGGTFQDCLEYGITCLRPLILDSRNGNLICRLREPNEQG